MFYFRMPCLDSAFSMARWRAEETQPGVSSVMSAFEGNCSATWGEKPRRVSVRARWRLCSPSLAGNGRCSGIGFLLLPAGSFEALCI